MVANGKRFLIFIRNLDITAVFLLPLAFPIIIEKGFPPIWFAITFGFYGVLLGILSNSRIINDELKSD